MKLGDITLIQIQHLFFMMVAAGTAVAQSPSTNTLIVHADSGRTVISRHIYGQFSEHLGRCIYGGIWVGENSPIPNTHGVRNDVIAALKKMKIPNLRWPGGCFADTYHWMDGVGPKSERAKIVNTTWGGVVEDNSFGTHEFLNMCEILGCEPVICGNIGSGSVKEVADWVEYTTSDASSPMTELRKKNGREKAWKVRFWGVGNETWGCGGIMTADYYSSVLRRYSYFMKNYGDNVLYKIASGSHDQDYPWTDVIMKGWSTTEGWLSTYMSGISLHYYTVCHDWSHKGSATEFDEKDWYTSIAKALAMEEYITNHVAVMDRYDPQKKIGLIVDEWGNWHDVEPGTNPSFLYQQNTLRDAITAALTLNIFHRHCDRVKMANIAQMVNVLQAVILTDNDKMILTPTYHVFDMYSVNQDATFLPCELTSDMIDVNGKNVPVVSATASRASDGSVAINLVNIHTSKDAVVSCSFTGLAPGHISGRILTAARIQDYNTFERPGSVVSREFTKFKKEGNSILITLPSKSVVVLEIRK